MPETGNDIDNTIVRFASASWQRPRQDRVWRWLYKGVFAMEGEKIMLHNSSWEYGFACVAKSMSKPVV